MVLTLAMAELLSRSGERIAFPALLPPFSARNGAERLAGALMGSMMNEASESALPDINQIRRFSEVVLVSDFLHPFDELTDLLDQLARRGVRAHLVEVADPAEETFPMRDVQSFATLRRAVPLLPVAQKPMPRTTGAYTSRVGKHCLISANDLAGAIRCIVQIDQRPKRYHDCIVL